MYAVVQIGSSTLRSAWGTKRIVPPRFCAWTAGRPADAVAATAAAPTMKWRRLSSVMADVLLGRKPDTSTRPRRHVTVASWFHSFVDRPPDAAREAPQLRVRPSAPRRPPSRQAGSQAPAQDRPRGERFRRSRNG